MQIKNVFLTNLMTNVLVYIVYFVDVNECDEVLDTCDQLCINIPGSYNCSCRQGYTLNSSSNACDAGRYKWSKTHSNCYNLIVSITTRFSNSITACN